MHASPCTPQGRHQPATKPPGHRAFATIVFACILCALVAAGCLTLAPAKYSDEAYAQSSPVPASSITWDQLKPHLEAGLGTPYVFGGATPEGWDCSGYASYEFNTFGGGNYIHYTTSMENQLWQRGSFVMEGGEGDLRDARMQPGDIIFFYSEGVDEPTHMGIVGERVDGIVMVYHAFTNSFSDIYGNSGTMLQGLDANPGSSLRGIWYMSSGHGKGNWSKFTVYRGVSNNGWVELAKSLDHPESGYGLSGCTYGIYSDSSCTQLVQRITTDDNGYAKSGDLRAGSYYVKEISANAWLNVDTQAYGVTVKGGETSQVQSTDTIKTNKLELQKASALPDVTEGNQNYSIAGARYLLSCPSTGWSVELTCDENGYASYDGLWANTYVIKEIAPSPGYALDETEYEYWAEPGETGLVNVEAGGVPEVPQHNKVDLVIQKLDSQTDDGSAQGDATLEGAQFTVAFFGGQYKSLEEAQQAAGQGVAARTWVLSSDSQGHVALDDANLVSGDPLYKDAEGHAILPLGTVFVTETQAPEGYLLGEPQTFQTNITGSGTGDTVDVYASAEQTDDVVRGGVAIGKIDRETKDHTASGGATLEGAQFTITNASAHAVLVDGESFEPGAIVATIETDSQGVAKTEDTVLPYGTYELKETKAPEGYMLDDVSAAWSETFQVRENGKTVDLTSADNSVTDRIARGDMRFNKVAAPSMQRMAHTAWRIVSQTTGEWHIVVADENGTIDTGADWNAHDQQTNANDVAWANGALDESKLVDQAGLWFSGRADKTTVPNNAFGALPFDTYTVEEVSTSANKDMNLVSFQVAVRRDGVNLDMGTVSDEKGPHIGTTLTDESGKHDVSASEEVTLVDTVAYAGLTEGKEYTMKGTLHLVNEDGTDAGILKDSSGRDVASEVTFTPIASAGTVEVPFTFDASQLAGRSVVAFETCNRGLFCVATHADISDQGQTVRVKETSADESGTPTGAGSSHSGGTYDKTGNVLADYAWIGGLVAAAIAASSACAAWAWRAGRRNNEDK